MKDAIYVAKPLSVHAFVMASEALLIHPTIGQRQPGTQPTLNNPPTSPSLPQADGDIASFSPSLMVQDKGSERFVGTAPLPSKKQLEKHKSPEYDANLQTSEALPTYRRKKL